MATQDKGLQATLGSVAIAVHQATVELVVTLELADIAALAAIAAILE